MMLADIRARIDSCVRALLIEAGPGDEGEPTTMLPDRIGLARPLTAAFVGLFLIAGGVGASAQPKPNGPAAAIHPAAPAIARPAAPAAPAFHPPPAPMPQRPAMAAPSMPQ